VLLAAGAQIRMDGKSRALDTLFVEGLSRSVKEEEVFSHGWASPREASPRERSAGRAHEPPSNALPLRPSPR
jgi:hypothetical protein